MSNDTRTTPGGHVILVAFDVHAPSSAAAHEKLMHGLRYVRLHPEAIDSWWVAEDERYDGSDNDSAVFVPMGSQAAFAEVIGSVREESEREATASRGECGECGRPKHAPLTCPDWSNPQPCFDDCQCGASDPGDYTDLIAQAERGGYMDAAETAAFLANFGGAEL